MTFEEIIKKYYPNANIIYDIYDRIEFSDEQLATIKRTQELWGKYPYKEKKKKFRWDMTMEEEAEYLSSASYGINSYDEMCYDPDY